MPPPFTAPDLPTLDRRERAAAVAHEQWSAWMDYFFSKCEPNEHGDLVVPKGYVAALRRQITTPYSELTDAEKDSDRAEADRYIEVVR